MTDFHPRPIVLEGRRVRLEPLAREHLEPLIRAGADPGIFRWHTTRMDGPGAFREWLDAALADQARGVALPFATVERRGGAVIGSTRFGNIDRPNLRVEIGWTWLAPPWQRTGANREAKWLMLRHAFESWGVRRVEFKAHAANRQSRTALARLGAIEEGTLRKHVVMPDGSPRDSVYYSILDDEWPTVKEALEASFEASRTPKSSARMMLD